MLGELSVIGTVFEILPCASFLVMNLKDQPNTLYISVILKILRGNNVIS